MTITATATNARRRLAEPGSPHLPPASISRQTQTHLRPLTRVALAALAAVYAIAATGSGLDRIIAGTPSSSPAAGSVPDLFADASLRRSAAIELSEAQFASAAELARKATIRSPLEPASTGLLAAVWLGQGKADHADKAFRVSGQLGWREPITQTYWMQAALLGGDLPVAVQRLDAILRQQPVKAADPALLAPFEHSEQGRTALARRLAENPGWTSVYLNPAVPISSEQLAQRAQVARLLANERRLGCDGISRFVSTLIAQGAVIPAHDVWQLHCPGGNGQMIADPDFASGMGKDPSPFGWQKYSDGSINLRSDSRNGGLVMENSAPFARNFARQMLVLAPGDYRLSWRATESDGSASERIEAFSGCPGETPRRIETRPIADTRLSGVLRITGGCDGQFLTFRVRPGPPGLNFGKIRLDTIGPEVAR